jgi:HD-like signal output (HDOD) protein
VQTQLETVWKDSIETAAACFVIAKRLTRVNPDQALLVGLLHVLGRLYIIMRAGDMDGLSDADIREVVGSWHATIGKAILESWGLPEALQHAVEHQDELETEVEGDVGITDILIAAKLLTQSPQDAALYPALKRLAALAGDEALAVLETHAEEFASVKSSLGD